MMKPLSPTTYYSRHKRNTLLLMGLVGLMTLGVCLMVRLLDSIPETRYNGERYLTRLSLVSATGSRLDPGVISQIRAFPDVAQVIQEKGLNIDTPTFATYHLFGITEADMQVLMDISDLRLKEGRLLRPRTNEMVLSEEIAKAMGIKIGDEIHRSIGEDWGGDNYYEDIPSPLELVGILEGNHAAGGPSIRLGFVSYEYVNDHELFVAPWRPRLVVIAREGRKAEVDDFLETEIASSHTNVMTHDQLLEQSTAMTMTFHLVFGVVDCLVAVVMALVVGMINQVAQAKRLTEFGVLHAIGHSRKSLIRRLALETICVAGLGWIAGLALSWLLFALLKTYIYEPRGMDLGLANLTPIWFTLPIPLAMIAFVVFSTMRAFARLDPVAIVERGKLSTEASSQQRAVKRSSTNPLSALTFYLRHRRRGLGLVIVMGLMILGVSFPAFIFTPFFDVMKPLADPLRQVGIVSSRMGAPVDPGVAAQIRAHPAVANVLPAIELPLNVELPPLPISIYAVSEDDLHMLIDLYGVHIKEGRLPQPYSNEIVLTESVALSRGVGVGDKIGQPVSEDDLYIPSEMVIAGILTSSLDEGEDDLWLGFASYEYISNHELYASFPVSLIVVPFEGHKIELDTWLQENMDTDQTDVFTFEWMQNNYRLMTLLVLLVFGIVESIIAIVAAIALAALSYTFFVQRREEFGTLHAIGHSRPWLVLRTVKETASVVTAAWLLGAGICGIGLAYMQASIYAPRGLALNFLNPSPWLFTLPIPVAVLAATSLTVTRTLSRLDPVSIIERRM